MKILVVTNMYATHNPSHPAQGVFVTEQVEALRELCDDVFDVFVIQGWRGRLAYLKSLLDVTRRVRADAYDVVHYHFGLSACSAPWVRLFSRAKIVVTFHGSDVMGRRWMRAISLVAARFAHARIGVTERITDAVRSRSGNCSTIPCAVNETLFSEPRHKRESVVGQRIVVFPSSPSRPEKDYPLFSEVVARLSDTFGFDIVERHIDDLDRDGVRDLLVQADCLVMTSIREGSPQSVKEAMAVNLPVVSVDVGDVKRLLDGVSYCAVLDERDAMALARAVAAVLNEGGRSNGRVRLESLGYFSADVAARVGHVYRSVLADYRGNEQALEHVRNRSDMAIDPDVSMKRIEFFSCPMDIATMNETVEWIGARIERKQFTQHVVVNVAKLVHLQTDAELAASVRACDIVNIDGMGVVWGARLLGYPVRERVAGVDLFERLLQMAAQRSLPVFLLGATDTVVARVAEVVSRRYPGLSIAGYHHGYFWNDEAAMVEQIRHSGARLLFVAITSPKKEIFINRWKDCLQVDFVMGVGGTFDVVAGKVRRAPPWMQRSGLEWAYRVMQEPRRMWKRYFVTNRRFALMLVKARVGLTLRRWFRGPAGGYGK